MYVNCYTNVFCFTLTVRYHIKSSMFHFVLQLTSAAGIFELRINSFTNDQAVDFNGQCCGNTTDGSTSYQCIGPCRTYFSLCLLHYLVAIPEYPLEPQCTLGQDASSVLGDNSFQVSNTDGLIQIHFPIDWPVSVILFYQCCTCSC